jgi:putative oxidoreductase
MLAIYQNWAPVVARIIFGAVFLFSASWKIPGTEMFTMQVSQTAAIGVPFASVAVTLAFLLEIIGGLALVIGWRTKFFAMIFILFVALLTALFHWPNMQDPMSIGAFINHLVFIAGLLYLSVYGAQRFALKKDI